ncbi:MAG: hypothetical protein KBD60_09000 [Sterolibacterium sp.]|nr:hypothetical protein [Sterolibacterium sp.]
MPIDTNHLERALRAISPHFGMGEYSQFDERSN